MSDTYVCGACKKTLSFIEGADEKAHKEAEEKFPDTPTDEYAIICDDCYKNIVRAMNTGDN